MYNDCEDWRDDEYYRVQKLCERYRGKLWQLVGQAIKDPVKRHQLLELINDIAGKCYTNHRMKILPNTADTFDMFSGGEVMTLINDTGARFYKRDDEFIVIRNYHMFHSDRDQLLSCRSLTDAVEICDEMVVSYLVDHPEYANTKGFLM